MKKILLGFSLSIILAGCGPSSESCFDAVKKRYSTCKDCQIIKESGFTFLVRRSDGSVVKVLTMNLTNTNITDSNYIFLPLQQTSKQ